MPQIEYIDSIETNNLLIARSIYSIDKNNILILFILFNFKCGCFKYSFSTHSQYPRNVFSCQQTKQAIGVYSSAYNTRFDTFGHILNYPQNLLLQHDLKNILTLINYHMEINLS